MENSVVSTDLNAFGKDDNIWYSTPKRDSQMDESANMLSSEQEQDNISDNISDNTSLSKMIPDDDGRRGSVSVTRPLKYIPLRHITNRDSKAALRKTKSKLENDFHMKSEMHLQGFSALSTRRKIRLILLFLVFLVSVTGTYILWFTNQFDNFVRGTMVISNSSGTYDWWKLPPVRPLLKVYVFNYTNIETFAERGGVLQVSQVGPFTYEETNERVEVNFNGNGTVSYREKKTYKYLPDMSIGDPKKKVFSPNILLMALMQQMKDYSVFAQYTADFGLKAIGTKPIQHIDPESLIWGYPDKIFSVAKALELNGRIPFEKFGLLVPKVNVSSNLITMHTGEGDISRLGQITRFNGRDDQGAWGSAECNKIEGSDGSQFPPVNLTIDSKLYVYNPDMCRRLPLVFKDFVEAQGLPAYRFHMPRDVFDNPERQPENQCFCPHKDTAHCLPSGVFNASSCNFGTPLIMSFPHFYLGDPSLHTHIKGLEPKAEDHDLYVDIHPKLGLTLGGVSRLQVNIQVNKAPYVMVNTMKQFKDGMVLPVAWFELIVKDFPTDLKTLLYHATITLDIVHKMLMYGFLAASIASAAVLCRQLFLKQNAKVGISNLDSDSDSA